MLIAMFAFALVGLGAMFLAQNTALNTAIVGVEPKVRQFTDFTSALLSDVTTVNNDVAAADAWVKVMSQIVQESQETAVILVKAAFTSHLDSVAAQLDTIDSQLEELQRTFNDVDTWATDFIDSTLTVVNFGNTIRNIVMIVIGALLLSGVVFQALFAMVDFFCKPTCHRSKNCCCSCLSGTMAFMFGEL